MEKSIYELVDQVQETHWWWLGRQRIIKNVIEHYCNLDKPLNIADVGSGYGANIPLLENYGPITALEMHQEALDKIKAKWPTDKVKAVQWKSPEPSSDRFDLMLLADVLEHIPDDKEAVDWMWNHLKPGGKVVITVPAHQFLWTEMDDVCHHFRRYSRPQLAKLFSDRFEINYCSYYNTTLFPVKLAFVALANTLRKILPKRPKQSYSDEPTKLINIIFRTILYLEAKIMPKVELPYGCSLIILATRPANQ